MRLPLKYIAVLVILSLAGIFSYQAYWLGGLYRTMRNDMERNIIEAMRMSDYNEMMLRVEKLRKDSTDHGEVSVSAGFEKDGIESKAYVHSTTSIDRNGRKEQSTTRQVITHNATAVPDSGNVLFIEQRKGRNEAQWLNPDAAQKKLEAAVKDTGNSPKAALRAKGGLDMILRDQNSMLELATYFQRGLHSGLDVISDPDVHVYDSLLTLQLKERGITLPHRLEHIYTSDKSSPHIFVDTLAVVSTAGYVPGPEAKQYNYAFDLNTHQSYRLWMEPVTQVAGFDWKINSALVGAFAAKEIFVTQMGILYAVEDGNSVPAAQQTLNARLKASYTPLQGISIMIFSLIALPCIGTVTVAKREAGTWWFALALFGGLTLLGFATATLIYQAGLLL